MAAVYEVQAIAIDGDSRVELLDLRLQDVLATLGLQELVDIVMVRELSTDAPGISLFFGADGGESPSQDDLERSLSQGRLVVPVVTALENFSEEIPPPLRDVNAHAWEPGGAAGLARLVLEQLGIEERQRRVFVSHRRTDALLMAEQLHDELTHFHFQAFLDRFGIRTGDRVQDTITDALEDCAFLLLIESPDAPDSRWVFYEAEYALSHYMGMCIVSWPNATEVPGTAGLPRIRLDYDDLENDRGFQVLTEDALRRVIGAVEDAHARGLVRRRQNMLVSVQEALEASQIGYFALSSWRLLTDQSPEQIIAVAPRLPAVADLHQLDTAAGAIGVTGPRVLVHAARRLRAPQQELLTWAAEGRELNLVAENAVGGYWGGTPPAGGG